MKVKAAPGIKCPMEGQPRKYITDAEAVDVPYTAYYIRRVNDGSLVAGTDAQAPSPPQQAAAN